MENGLFIDDLRTKNCDFPVRKLLVYQRVTQRNTLQFEIMIRSFSFLLLTTSTLQKYQLWDCFLHQKKSMSTIIFLGSTSRFGTSMIYEPLVIEYYIYICMCIYIYIIYIYISGWWYTYPSEKYESQLG